MIYRLDWARAWKDGDLDEAVLDIVEDDAAINGCRPEFVALGGRSLLATADYGDVRPEIRLYDPAALLAAGRSSAPGVVVSRVLCGPFNQSPGVATTFSRGPSTSIIPRSSSLFGADRRIVLFGHAAASRVVEPSNLFRPNVRDDQG